MRELGNSPPAWSREAAEAIALQGPCVPGRGAGAHAALSSWLPGCEPSDVRARAGTPELLSAVLEHLAGDESLLLVFAASRRVAPESIGQAIAAAAGPLTA